MRGQHARRRIREHIGESRARHGDELVAVGAAALAEEQQSLGVAGTAERHVVDEALSCLMPQIHRPFFRRRANVLLIDSGSSALNPCNAVTRGSDAPVANIGAKVRVADEPKGDTHSGVVYAPGDGWSGWGVVTFSLLLVGQTGTL